jgi:hypothetical protein
LLRWSSRSTRICFITKENPSFWLGHAACAQPPARNPGARSFALELARRRRRRLVAGDGLFAPRARAVTIAARELSGLIGEGRIDAAERQMRRLIEGDAAGRRATGEARALDASR